MWPTWKPFRHGRRGYPFAQQARGNLCGAAEGSHVSAVSGQTGVLFTADTWEPFGNEERFLRVCCRRGSSLPHSLMTSTGVVYNNGRDVATFPSLPHLASTFPAETWKPCRLSIGFPRLCHERTNGYPFHGRDVETFWKRGKHSTCLL